MINIVEFPIQNYNDHHRTTPIKEFQRSSILEVRIKDVRTAAAHLRPFDVGCTTVEFGLVPLAFLKFVPPLHTFLGGNLGLRLELVHVKAPELFDLQILACVIW